MSAPQKCCGNRREAVCPSCAETYRADAYQLVAAGLRGGKGVPDSVTEHPMLFVTLTAPSFGAVHVRRVKGRKTLPCRPRDKARVCPHGVRVGCSVRHAEGDPVIGTHHAGSRGGTLPPFEATSTSSQESGMRPIRSGILLGAAAGAIG